mmetsp:Transcript_17229/g.31008  ORF Transcript_17229/g.31008 Transcript_17229/m.31008 type:complete len:153 (-) Transcript_17229:13452-13910(-)
MARRDATSQLKAQLEAAVRNTLKETHCKARLKAELAAMSARLQSFEEIKSELEAKSDDLLRRIEEVQAGIESGMKTQLATLYGYIEEARAANSRLVSNSDQDLSKALETAKKKLEFSASFLSDVHTRLHSLYCISCGSSLQTSCRLCKALRI